MAKYAHYSDIDPEFAAIKSECDANFGAVWKLSLAELKVAWQNTPPALGPYVPDDIDIHFEKVAARDGTEIGIKIYKAKDASEGAKLYLVSHGGGFVVGSHSVEEATNRLVAGAGSTVVSVDYRMYAIPWYKCSMQELTTDA